MMEVSGKKYEDRILLKLTGRIDSDNAGEAEKAAAAILENGNYKAIDFYHILGIVITALVTMSIPVFFGLMIIDRYEIVMNFINNYAWIKSGLAAVSNLLAAVGFALLLSYMDIKDYWPFMLIGYALFAFFGASTMAIAIVAISVGYIYVFKLKKEEKGGAK